MRRSCAVFSCANRDSNKNDNVSMYRFPADPALCEKWVEFCRSDQINEMLVLQGVAKLRSSSFCVCSDHFAKPCFVSPRNNAQGIYKGSVPTIIAGHPMLVSSFKKANQIPEYSDLVPEESEQCEEDHMTVEVLQEELDEAVEPPDAEPANVQPTQPPACDANQSSLPTAAVSGIIHPSVFDCQCEVKSEFEPKFYAERSRAVGLVEELDDTKKKIVKLRKPYRQKQRALHIVNDSIKRAKDKLRRLAKEHHITVDLVSSDEEEQNFVF
ncbi:THAP domain-containing protein 3 [Aedes albopictus]|uniref:THAP-type domain-containing protein n=1 Tax=Aedes albopictus TaxID=7160 RepID=A0ABM1ZFN2_AEDAL